MSEPAESFVAYLSELAERDRGALAHLRRGLGFAPGAYPPAYPFVEPFVGADRHAEDPWRKALYLTAGLFAFHPVHHEGKPLETAPPLATALGRLGRARESTSIEQRFIALLGAETEILPHLLRQVVSLLAADGLPCDFARLLNDLSIWLRVQDSEGKDRLRQRWAREFYPAYNPMPEPEPNADSVADGVAVNG